MKEGKRSQNFIKYFTVKVIKFVTELTALANSEKNYCDKASFDYVSERYGKRLHVLRTYAASTKPNIPGEARIQV